MNYLDELNEPQRKAVECTEGPVMIIAGAGSGKTRVLTYRIAHLIQKGVDPFQILALTFTNKAARSMKERVEKIVGNNAKNLWMGTFHSVFAKILRAEAEKLGYPSNFTIYDTDDSKGLIKTILKEQGLDEKIYKPSTVLSRISDAKNKLISAAAYNANPQTINDDKMAAKPKIGLVYELYSKRCFKAGAMDFDDLLFKTNVLLRDFPEVLHKYQHKFKYIMVDEYQDTNFSQYVIVKQLAALNENICVVGDDAQSIYAFRGANIQNILNFEKDYPDLHTFKLEQNYRSTQNIVNAANTVIENNQVKLKKEVWTSNDTGEKIKVMRAMSDNEEGLIVAHSIFETKMNNQSQNTEFAILYRTNAQSRSMEEALRKKGIPYRIYGGMSFYHRKEIKDILAYFRLSINNHDEEALKRIINYPARGIGNTTIEKMIVAASDNDVSIWTVMENLNDFNLELNAGTREKIIQFYSTIKSFTALLHTQNAFDCASHIAIESGVLKDLYTDKTPEGVARNENIQELLNGVKDFSEEKNEAEELVFKTLPEFMEDIALLTDADKKESPEEKDVVSLMTIHASKGLEFPYVYIVGVEENLFPSQMSLNSRTDLEEERRLFYVALTRAEKKVSVSYATTRYKWGNLTGCEPSRFIDELGEAFVEMPPARNANAENQQSFFKTFAKKETTENKISVPPKKNFVKVTATKNSSNELYDNSHLKDLQVGMEVMHERFGNGKVIHIEGIFPNNKATVFFQGVGQKQLLLKFAKLTIMS
ncbi:MAG TPA: UvrD-helicase domain-containing protein [Bacteroidia bacterium]|nr:UvrD-helicase domain-containing protein [Bacteroidia bacterium]